MVATSIAPSRTRPGRFFVWMAGLCVLIAFGGFAETYWLQLLPRTFVGGPLIHLHGLLFSAWTLLLFSQTWLAANRQLDHHRAWGLVGVSLATALVLVGTATALQSMVSRIPTYGDAARAFLIVPMAALTGFALLFTAAIANIRRPDWHRRFMLIATYSLLQAAMARIFFLIATGGGPGARPGLGPPPPAAVAVAPGLVLDLLIVTGMIYDWRTRGRVHPAYLVGGVLLLALQLLGGPVSRSHLWLALADHLGAFVR